MIIVSITGPRMSDALAQIASSDPWAEAFEFRFDLIRSPALAVLLLATHKPVIATCRPAWEGGEFRGSEEERLDILAAASLLGAEYVDIEIRAGARTLRRFIGRRRESGVIVSYHAKPGSRPGTAEIYRRMRKTGADVLKFAFHAKDAWENRVAFDFLAHAREDRQRAIAVAMGEAGEPSRILYKVFGGWGTYAAPESGEAAAPGQLTGRTLSTLYRAGRLTPATSIFGVVGNPVRQSRGVRVHNPLFARAGINAVYCRFAVIDLGKFFARIVPLLRGFSVTHPHKVSIGRYLDAMDPISRAIGAVNTVVRKGGRLSGTNTDAPAALDAIEHVVSVDGKRLLIMGAGGAARAIAYEAKKRGALVTVTGRTPRSARTLAREFGVAYSPVSLLKETDADILVNATPVGMAPHAHQSPFPRGMLKGRTVFDAVYVPAMTTLLREAASAGASIVRGTEMYVNQAAMQFRLYAGVRANIPLMKKLLLDDGEDT